MHVVIVWATSASRCLTHSPFRLSDSETDCPADHRRRATGIAPVRSSGIEREARGLSECRGDELVPRLRQTFADRAGCLCLKQAAEKLAFGAGETYPFDKLRAGSQGLKPDVFPIAYGPTKVVP